MSKKFILIFYVTRDDLYIDLLQNIRPLPRYTQHFSLIASIVSNRSPFNGLLRWWKSQKSHGAGRGSMEIVLRQ